MKIYILTLSLFLFGCSEKSDQILPLENTELSTAVSATVFDGYGNTDNSGVMFEKIEDRGRFLGFYHSGYYVGFLGKDPRGTMILEIGAPPSVTPNSIQITPYGIEILNGADQKALLAYNGAYYIDYKQVLGPRLAEISHPSDNASTAELAETLRKILDAMETHGLIEQGTTARKRK
jgi:hypothetical protein